MAGLALLSGIAACGSTSSGPAPPATDPLAGLTAKQIADKARADLLALPSFQMAGSVTDSGKTFTVDITIVPRKACQGTARQSGPGTVNVIIIGTSMWVKASAAYWRTASRLPPAAVALVAGKFVLVPVSQSAKGIKNLCGGNVSASNHIWLRRGQIVTINGQRTVMLIGSNNRRAYVTDTAMPQLVRITGPGSSDYADITALRSPATITPPPASQVYSPSPPG